VAGGLSAEQPSPLPRPSIWAGAWTLPNGITALRLASVPVYLWLVFGAHRYVAAAVVLGCLGATDWVDGFLARRLGQVSELGKILDPTADRILVVTSVLSVAGVGAVPWWFAGLTLAREVLVSGAVLLLASMGSARIDVLFIGKMGTFTLMFSYPAFLLGFGPAGWQRFFVGVGWATGLLGLVCAWAALVSYVGPARAALARGRAARRSGALGAPEPRD
jgi:cardiolipin synthase (CMP-forming)